MDTKPEWFVLSNRWREAYPAATVGVLAMRGVANPESHPALEAQKAALEGRLRARYAGGRGVTDEPVLRAYQGYYKRFKKTYHVELQLKSLALKGKPIPRGAALVEAMFMAELENLILTAGHDLRSVAVPIEVGVSDGTEGYVRFDGQEQRLKAGDMMMADAQGVISTVIYGPDYRTRITPQTQEVAFTVYAPAPIGEQAVLQHLEDIRRNVLLFSPSALTEVLGAWTSE